MCAHATGCVDAMKNTCSRHPPPTSGMYRMYPWVLCDTHTVPMMYPPQNHAKRAKIATFRKQNNTHRSHTGDLLTFGSRQSMALAFCCRLLQPRPPQATCGVRCYQSGVCTNPTLHPVISFCVNAVAFSPSSPFIVWYILRVDERSECFIAI